MKTDKSPEYLNQILEDMVNQDGANALYTGLKNRYMSHMVEATPFRSTLAFAICEMVENGTPFEPDIYGKFPTGVQKYLERSKAYKKQLKPLQAQIKGLNAERIDIETRLDEATDETRRTALTEELTNTQMELIDLSEQRDSLKEPVYRTIYDSDRSIFTKKGKRPARQKKDVVLEKDWQILQKYYREETKKIDPAQEQAAFGNMQVLHDALGLSDHQIELLKFMVVHERSDDLGMVVDNLVGDKQAQYNAIIAKMTKVPFDIVNRNLHQDSMMVEYGLIEMDQEGANVPIVSEFVRDLIADPSVTPDDIKARLSGRVMKTDLDWHDDFNHMGDYGRDLEKLVLHAYDAKKRGEEISGPVIWFTGEPDTGKTSAAIALVQHLQKTNPALEIRLIGEKISHGHDEQTGLTNVKKLNPEDRMSQILISTAMTKGNPNIIYLVEEPESFMPRSHDYSRDEGGEGPVERVIVQRLFEQNPATAIIFTTNHADEIHPAVRRRGVELEFDLPGRDQRHHMIERILERNELELSQDQIARLARTYIVPAGKWASAIRNAKITADTPDQVFDKIGVWLERQAERDHGNAAAIKSPHVYKGDYDLSLVHLPMAKPGMDAENFLKGIETVARKGEGFEILLEGWPGTGKSEMGWMLADRLDKEVIYIQRSDILNMFVGGSEGNLARAFKQAAERKAILMIDEVETLVPTRGGQNQNHENSLVAEFLTQMDLFREKGGMIIVTTNHAGRMDPAVERRFDDRLTFDFLKPAQAMYAWNKFFDQSLPTSIVPELQKMTRLTPADFARVARAAKRTDMIEKPDLLLAALQQRERDKPRDQQPRRRKNGTRIGFLRDDLPPVNNDNNGHHPHPEGTPLPPVTVTPAKANRDAPQGLEIDVAGWRTGRIEAETPQYRPFGTT